MTMRPPWFAVLTLLALAGCSAATTPGSRYQLTDPRPWGIGTVQWLTICNPNPDLGPVTCNVVLTSDPADQEAWQFEARVRVVSGLGIPYGREPRDFLVAGTQEQCEATRRAMRSKPHTFYAEETPPTEPCKGPLHFKRLPTEAVGQVK